MDMPERANLTRREWLKGVVSLGAGAALAGCSHTRMRNQPSATSGRKPDSVWAENQKPGTNEWLLGKTEIDTNTKYRSHGSKVIAPEPVFDLENGSISLSARILPLISPLIFIEWDFTAGQGAASWRS
jgi:hypothetical protein